MLTVIGPAGGSGSLALRGLFIGDDEECFKAAAKLSLEVNFTLVPRPIQKVGRRSRSVVFVFFYFVVVTAARRRWWENSRFLSFVGFGCLPRYVNKFAQAVAVRWC